MELLLLLLFPLIEVGGGEDVVVGDADEVVSGDVGSDVTLACRSGGRHDSNVLWVWDTPEGERDGGRFIKKKGGELTIVALKPSDARIYSCQDAGNNTPLRRVLVQVGEGYKRVAVGGRPLCINILVKLVLRKFFDVFSLVGPHRPSRRHPPECVSQLRLRHPHVERPGRRRRHRHWVQDLLPEEQGGRRRRSFEKAKRVKITGFFFRHSSFLNIFFFFFFNQKSSFDWTAVNDIPADASSHTVYGLLPNSTYFFR